MITIPVAEIRQASRRYPGVVALDRVDFAVQPGEVRAILGKNGAGKSTLIRLLTGAETPDDGTVLLAGEPFREQGEGRTREAAARGLRAVYQELSLVPSMSIAENMFLGAWLRRSGMLDHARMVFEARQALARLGLTLDPSLPVSSLSPAARQMVEIARAFLGTPKLVILDEPTSSLAAAEVDQVCAAVRDVAAQGTAVLYVSHRMSEIRRLADTATVLRDGRIISTLPVAEARTEDIVQMMLGRSEQARQITPQVGGRPLLSVQGLSLPPKLQSISLDLKEGEVLGIAGLLGSGRTELIEAILGFTKPAAGIVAVDGKAIARRGYRSMIRRGFGYTPESRKEDGIIPLLGVDENTVITDFRRVDRIGVLSTSAIARATRGVVERLHVKTAATTTPIGTLSGGNQQKVVIGRWIHARSRILLLDEPTRGVDVEAKNQIYDIIRGLAREGRAILFVSSEIEELDQVCDRVLVLRDGQIAEEHTAPDIDAERLLAACIG
ncbi:sugar ABC transporter ATP-binding protein [Acidisoma cellulosilytica]|uniref:Sugar ABC transporter ATP-binding protein n=1 Tax=Acidisoma cellulosilyticum TaxID=2802395 RepID=A0A964E6N1_9PROT|nr:sugar ABC transporter ATP-binding protein [Acidisoma cellulosilyticum]MCB8883756.1 sugar ABC transporter ATP-binding protein [Acidisoma cellulosilyticum]